MFARKTSFEIHVQRDDRYVIDGVVHDEEEAINLARGRLRRGGIQGVKVLKIRKTTLGAGVETEIFAQTALPADNKPTTQHSEDGGGDCASYEDLQSLRARISARRVLKPFLDQNHVTLTEVMHVLPVLRRLMDLGNTFSSAVGRIAAQQAKASGQPVRRHMNQLFDLADHLRKRADHAWKIQPVLTEPDPDRFDTIHDRVATVADGQDPVFLRRAALALHLNLHQGIAAKRAAALTLAERTSREESWALADHAIAELLMAAEHLQEVIGDDGTLGGILTRIAHILHGHEPPAEPGDPDLEQRRRLIALIGNGRLPQCRGVLLERMRKELAGTTPLNAREPERDGRTLAKLLEVLMGDDHEVPGGAAMLRAIEARRDLTLERARSFVAQGGRTLAGAGGAPLRGILAGQIEEL